MFSQRFLRAIQPSKVLLKVLMPSLMQPFTECLQGSKSNQEKRFIKSYLSNFPVLLITTKISERAIGLIDLYSNSFGLFLPDALIAATALENDLTVVNYNIDDFKFINGLKYLKPTI